MAYGAIDYRKETVANFFGLLNRAGKVRRLLDGKGANSMSDMADRAEAEVAIEERLEGV